MKVTLEKSINIYFSIGLVSVLLSFISLAFLNFSLFTNSMLTIAYPLPILTIILSIIALLNKESRKYGLYGLGLTVFTFVFLGLVVVMELNINYHP